MENGVESLEEEMSSSGSSAKSRFCQGSSGLARFRLDFNLLCGAVT